MTKPRFRRTSAGWFHVTGWMAGRKLWLSETVIPDERGRLAWQELLIGPYPSLEQAFEAATGWARMR